MYNGTIVVCTALNCFRIPFIKKTREIWIVNYVPTVYKIII